MRLLTSYNVYLFDFDYTLVDSSRGILICFRNVLDRWQFTDIPDDAIKRTIGKTLKESFSILTGRTDPDQLESMRKEYVNEADTHMNANTVFLPETIAVLNRLKEQGAQIGIVSTKYRFRIENYVKDYFPSGFFDVIIGGEDVDRHKPSPESIFLALKRLNRTPKEALYIGDSIVDAQAAQAAGIDFCGTLTGMTTASELQAFPHRFILNDLSGFLSTSSHMMKRKKISPLRLQLRKWDAIRKLIHIKQIRGRSIPEADLTETTLCKNCGHTFIGNYCNHCAQNKNVQRFNFRSGTLHALSGLSNIDRGFGHTLLELLYRPGYMISDYISGKRVRYFRPFQTLFVMAAIYILLVQFIDPNALKDEVEEQTTNQQETAQSTDQIQISSDTINNEINRIESSPDWIDKMVDGVVTEANDLSKKKFMNNPFLQRVWNIIINWARGNKAVSIILTLPFFAIATRWAFRKSRYNCHYNYTEHIFAQTYIACQILLISSIYLLLHGKADTNNLYNLSILGVFILFTWDFKQLFGETWVRTIGRTLRMFFYSLLLIILSVIVFVALLIVGSSLLKAVNP